MQEQSWHQEKVKVYVGSRKGKMYANLPLTSREVKDSQLDSRVTHIKTVKEERYKIDIANNRKNITSQSKNKEQ